MYCEEIKIHIHFFKEKRGNNDGKISAINVYLMLEHFYGFHVPFDYIYM